MAWIKVESPTPNKPEILQLSRILEITRDDAFGKAMRFWLWMDEMTVDGHVDGVTSTDVDTLVDASGFAAAMQKVGWLKYDDAKERLSVPNFERHNGETAKSRALKAKRQAKWRASRVDGAASTPPSTPPSTVEKKREEKRREEKRKKKKPSFDPGEVELPFPSPEFLSVWREWCQHRKEINKPLTETATRNQLRQFSDWGEVRAIAAMRHTMAQGWQGLREPEAGAKPRQGKLIT
jgi:hypothetical protein